MVRAWFYEGSPSDQRLPNIPEPPSFLDLDYLKSKLGVLYFKIDADNYENEGKLGEIKKERNYNYEDCITCDKAMDNYSETLKKFFTEHLHCDEEIRFIVDGGGYFDVRNENDKWVRIECQKGDMLILPAGIYHRFTLDSNDYIKAIRCFSGVPVWTPFNRDDPKTEAMDVRQKYIGKA